MNIQRTQVFSWVILGAIVLSAFLLRYVNIENIPSGIYPDEAVNGINAQDANATGNYQLFYIDNNGREGLFINLQALSIKYFGNNVAALKLWSAIFGTLTVLGVYLLSKEVFLSTRAGLISAFLTAFSYWAINFSRIGFRAIMVPFILSFSFYFLLKGFRTRNFLPFIISGLIFGLGFHTYIAFRIAPAIIAVLIVFAFATRKHFLKEYWKEILVFGASALITLSPMLYTFYTHPEYLQSRSASVSVFSPEMNQGNLLKTITRSVSLSLAKYNFWGDQNWRHNYPPYPILNPLTGAAFLVGFIYVIAKTLHLFWLRVRHQVRDRKFYIYVFLLAWFFGMLAPEFLTAEGLPHALRSIGTLPIVMIFATIPFLWIIGKSEQWSHSARIALATLLFFVFTFIATVDPIKYFVFFANNPKQHESFNANLKQIAYYMRSLPQSTEKFVVAENMERIPIQFLNRGMKNVNYVYSGQIEYAEAKGSEFTFLMSYQSQELIDKIKQNYPNLTLYTHETRFGNFYELK